MKNHTSRLSEYKKSFSLLSTAADKIGQFFLVITESRSFHDAAILKWALHITHLHGRTVAGNLHLKEDTVLSLRYKSLAKASG